jgi:ParB family chromosome partitioning protein
MSRPRSRGLGRGLEALIPLPLQGDESEGGLPQFVGVDEIQPSAEQMRRRFPEEAMRELADSIRQHGVLQPVLVKRLQNGYELIAGERRWRAAKLAGLDRIPAIVRQNTEAEESLLLGLIENLQREDLDPISEAKGIQRLIEQFGLTHEEAAGRLGKHRVAVTQSLRLLNACPAVVSAVAGGAITAGHARALVGLPSPEAQEQGLKAVLGRQLSVRQTERWVREYRPPAPVRRRESGSAADVREVLRELRGRYGRAVSVRGSLERGQIVVRYGSSQELGELVSRLMTDAGGHAQPDDDAEAGRP